MGSYIVVLVVNMTSDQRALRYETLCFAGEKKAHR